MLAAALILASPNSAHTASPVSVDVSSDIHWTPGAQVVADEKAIRIDLPASVTAIDLGLVPVAADVVGYHRYENLYHFFAVDIPTDLTQGLVFPQNVIAWDGGTYYLAFDPETAAIPRSAGIDAISWRQADGTALLSFDVTVQLPGGLVVADEDIAAWNGVTWSLFFDGSARGIPANLDVNGFHFDPATSILYFSFDTSGQLGNVFFNDEDVVALDGQNWSLALDSSVVFGPDFAAGDLDALGIRTAVLFRDGFESPGAGN